jgi:hypothetical protein
MKLPFNVLVCLVAKKKWKRPLARYRHRWEDMKLHLKEIGYVYFDRIYLNQEKPRWDVVNTLINI